MPDIEARTEKHLEEVTEQRGILFHLNPSDQVVRGSAPGGTSYQPGQQYYEYTLIWEGCLDEQFQVITDQVVSVAAIYFEHLKEIYAAGPGEGDTYEHGFTLYVDKLDTEGHRVTGTHGDSPLMQFDWPM